MVCAVMACLAVVVGATWTLVNLDAGKSSKQSVAGGVQLDATNVGAFSTEALANAGLRDDVVRVFDYKGATYTDAGWDVNMDVSSCPTGSPGQECRSIGSASMRVQSEMRAWLSPMLQGTSRLRSGNSCLINQAIPRSPILITGSPLPR